MSDASIFDLPDMSIRFTIVAVVIQNGGCVMRINIQTKGFDLTDGLREHTQRCLQFAFGWAQHNVRKVTVRLSDINGPRGGSDKRCQIQFPLPHAQDVVIEDTESDIYVAIDRAAERAGQTLDRRLSRQREFAHARGSEFSELTTEDAQCSSR